MNPEKNRHKLAALRRAASGKLAYSRKELAALLGISTRSLRRLEQRGLLMPSRALRKKLYSAKAVDAFLEGTS